MLSLLAIREDGVRFDQRWQSFILENWQNFKAIMAKLAVLLVLLSIAATPIPSPKTLGTWPAKPSSQSPVWPVSPAEVWLAASPTAPRSRIVSGNGTPQAPFSGDFDFIFSNMPPACRIHAGPGRFRSACSPGLWMKLGQHFSGAGMGITTIWRDRAFSLPDKDMSVLKGTANFITIEDMTLDANGDPSDQVQRNGINMFGNLCTVHRVEVIHSTGNWTNGNECFPIFMGFGSGSYGNIVKECYIHDPMGYYVSAIDINGQGLVLNNRVEFATWQEGHFQSYLAAYSHDTLIAGNVAKGGNIGFYTDTGDEHNLTIRDNSFDGCQQGIILFKAPGYSLDGLRILDNNISIITNSWQEVNGWSSTGIGLWMKTGAMSNVTVSGNSIRSVTTNGSSIWIIGTDTNKVSNLRVENNLLPGGTMLVQPQATISGNVVDPSISPQ